MTLQNQPPKRYLSLDVLRGITVAFMIVVNTPGSWSSIYSPFAHATWHGFTLTDLVFPTFLFVVGNAISFSFKKIDNQPFSAFFGRLLKRSVIIFLIGVLLNHFPFIDFGADSWTLKDISSVRILGVLQRIALCYFLGGLIIYFFRKASTLLLISTGILLMYWLILYLFGTGNDPYALETNAPKLFDDLIFNAKNLYQGLGITFEPEGVLSTLPSIVHVIVGYLIGKFIQVNGNKRSTFLQLLVIATTALAIGLLWDTVFPINKSLWTSSYVLYALGWDIFILAVLMGIIDLLHLKRWTYFFEVFGKNPLFIYILAWVIISALHIIPVNGSTVPSLFYRDFLLNHFADKTASLLFAVCYMLLLWLIGFALDKNKIYVKV
ncbi:acyltransferase family protein [Sphingobacterium corticis]|uniref:Acyltransferase family protein n=1 Tax=Sphingobacterium corticis TaxID=1812823 RepID=A0ABW5NKG8_9SPHI